MSYKHFVVEQTGGVVSVTMNRPDVHNAFNDELIAEAIELFGSIGEREGARVAVLRGVGPNFCAGADLNWMTRIASYTRDENVRDSTALAKMFAVMNECPLPLVGRIQGAAIGGGVGLVSVCDVAIATTGSKFGLTEVKLGIIPSVISPYVTAKIGESNARSLFMTGERFGAERALHIGLVHAVAADEAELDRMVDQAVSNLLTSGPEAVRACKRLIRYVVNHPIEDVVPYTIETIAGLRVSPEAQDGMQAFLKKEKAPWVQAK